MVLKRVESLTSTSWCRKIASGTSTSPSRRLWLLEIARGNRSRHRQLQVPRGLARDREAVRRRLTREALDLERMPPCHREDGRNRGHLRPLSCHETIVPQDRGRSKRVPRANHAADLKRIACSNMSSTLREPPGCRNLKCNISLHGVSGKHWDALECIGTR